MTLASDLQLLILIKGKVKGKINIDILIWQILFFHQLELMKDE